MSESDQSPGAQARASLAEAGSALDADDNQRAYDLLNKALERIGDSYYDPNLRDDTNLRKLAAHDLFNNGNVGPASRMLHSVLTERLVILEAKQ